MTKKRHTGFEDEGIHWEGTRKELDEWKEYKMQRAHEFVSRGYSVAWCPDGDNWMDVYHPQRHHVKEPELRASVKFFREPSKFGMDGGRISKLTIQTRDVDPWEKVLGRSYETVETVFNYDRGTDVNRLPYDARARKLYDVVQEILG